MMMMMMIAHCDGSYTAHPDSFRPVKTLFTVHLYLNDSQAEDPSAELAGGSTPFFSPDETRRLDVHPKAGRVLIFQHYRLVHSGDDVRTGTKYTVRMDLLYEFVPKEDLDDEGRKVQDTDIVM